MIGSVGTLPARWHSATRPDLRTVPECQSARTLPPACAYPRGKTPRAGTLSLCPGRSPLDLGTLPGTLPWCWHSAQVSGEFGRRTGHNEQARLLDVPASVTKRPLAGQLPGAA
jgi:hypothetical protein